MQNFKYILFNFIDSGEINSDKILNKESLKNQNWAEKIEK